MVNCENHFFFFFFFNFGDVFGELWLFLDRSVFFFGSSGDTEVLNFCRWRALLHLFSRVGHNFSYLAQKIISSLAGRGTYQTQLSLIGHKLNHCCGDIVSNGELFLIKLSWTITPFYVTGSGISGGFILNSFLKLILH